MAGREVLERGRGVFRDDFVMIFFRSLTLICVHNYREVSSWFRREDGCLSPAYKKQFATFKSHKDWKLVERARLGLWSIYKNADICRQATRSFLVCVSRAISTSQKKLSVSTFVNSHCHRIRKFRVRYMMPNPGNSQRVFLLGRVTSKNLVDHLLITPGVFQKLFYYR